MSKRKTSGGGEVIAFFLTVGLLFLAIAFVVWSWNLMLDQF